MKQTAISLTAVGIGIVTLLSLPRAAPAQETQSGLHARIEVEQAQYYRHETFDLTLVVTAIGERLGSQFQLQGMPDETVLACEPFRELPVQREQTGTQLHEIRRFRCRARAMRAGALRLTPRLAVTTLTRKRLFFGSGWVETERTLTVPPVSLTILPLPTENRPPDFSGAVGQFQFDVVVTPTNLSVGDIVYVRSTIRGNGYIEPVSAPVIPERPGFKLYAAEPIKGTDDVRKAFEQIVVPGSRAANQVPALRFNYFDPRTGSFQTLTAGPFPLHFQKRTVAHFEQFRPALDTNITDSEAISQAGDSHPFEPPPPPRTAWARLLRTLHGPPEAILREDARARVAPGIRALPTFAVSTGERVQVIETTTHWARIRRSGDTGWVPLETLAKP